MSRASTPKQGSFRAECWEAHLSPEEVEGFLSEQRRENPQVIVQVFGASEPPNPAALTMIAAQTLAAAGARSTLAEKPELDLLLRLAGTRQIGEAFARVGYKTKGKRLFLLAATSQHGGDFGRLTARISSDRRFSLLEKKPVGDDDLQMVERAALLAVRL